MVGTIQYMEKEIMMKELDICEVEQVNGGSRVGRFFR